MLYHFVLTPLEFNCQFKIFVTVSSTSIYAVWYIVGEHIHPYQLKIH